MPKGVYDRSATSRDETAADDKMFPVRLLRNYHPKGKHEIIGYHKPAVKQKNAAGQMVEIEPEEFVKGEMHPPKLAGTGFPNKIWKETLIALSIDEAKEVISKRIAERADPVAA